MEKSRSVTDSQNTSHKTEDSIMMHIFSMKPKTKQVEIRNIAPPPVLHIPLLQHIGKPAIPVVQIGDRVKKYQLLAQAAEGLSANVHSPVSGLVTHIDNYPLADGTLVPSVTIENDGKEEEVELSSQCEEKSADEIIEIIRQSGIVGEGGAQFPTDIKYNTNGSKINTFIINGTECEPYLTADYAVMTLHTEEVLKGILIVNKILNAADIVITIEKQNKELVGIFESLLNTNPAYKNIRIKVLPNTYPQGGELQIIKSVTGIELPRNKRPYEVSVIVNNVGTIYAIYQAVAEGKPLISRYITLSGEKATRYGNFEVLIGTPISHILKEMQFVPEDVMVVLGGPMMGKYVDVMDAPIVKGSSGILLLKNEGKKRYNCISCGYCVDVCPMYLMPMKFEEIYRSGTYFKLEKYSISNCIECAACEYICPSNVPLIESIKKGKSKLKELANAIE